VTSTGTLNNHITVVYVRMWMSMQWSVLGCALRQQINTNGNSPVLRMLLNLLLNLHENWQTVRQTVGDLLAKCLRIFLHLLQYQLHGGVGNDLLYLGILHSSAPHGLRVFALLHQTAAQTTFTSHIHGSPHTLKLFVWLQWHHLQRNHAMLLDSRESCY